ncbi:hypothetical protein V6N13_005230 [Hibiscus sabdariffa]
MYPADTILNRAITWARYYSGIRQQNSSLVPIRCDPIQWKYPEPEWICLNVDGEVSIVTGTGSIGGLLRDYAGSWIFNFQKGIGKYVIHLHSSSEYLRPFLSHDAHSTSIGHT